MRSITAVTFATMLGLAACSSQEAATPAAGNRGASNEAAPDETAAACRVIDSRDWKAWVNRMPNPDEGPTLHVTGEIDLPTPGYTITWRVGPADRMNPPAQFLELVATPPEDPVVQVITPTRVHYRGEAVYAKYRAVRVRCGDRVIAEIADITDAW